MNEDGVMFDEFEKSKCTGCSVCAITCPVGCITMRPDDLGFLYPQIDTVSCIKCNHCKKVCPIYTSSFDKKDSIKMEAFAIKHPDDSTRLKSSSGGVFSLLAQSVFSNGGIVYGAAFDEEFHVAHQGVSDTQAISPIRGTKIIPSNSSSVFKEIKTHLDANHTVLFTGTPCQVNSLHTYLKNDYNNLFTQDLICHGVCSPKVFSQYLKMREEQQGARITSIELRNKKYGWRDYSVRLIFDDGSQYLVSHSKDNLMRVYLKNYALRPSCYNCKFKGNNRTSDITLADMWGAEKIVPMLDDNKGLSLVICRSPKGKKLIESFFPETESLPVNYDLAVSYNKSAVESAKEPKNNQLFCEDLDYMDFDTLVKKYCKDSFVARIKKIVKCIIR